LYESERWAALVAAGARPQRLLWASTGTKNAALPAGYYIGALAAAGTINTVPENTLLAIGASDALGDSAIDDGASADAVVAGVEAAGVDLDALASRLQQEGRDAFVADFDKLIQGIRTKSRELE
jgi:transaldolase